MRRAEPFSADAPVRSRAYLITRARTAAIHPAPARPHQRTLSACSASILVSAVLLYSPNELSKFLNELSALVNASLSALKSFSEISARAASSLELLCDASSSSLSASSPRVEFSSELANSSELRLESSSSVLSLVLSSASRVEISESRASSLAEIGFAALSCCPAPCCTEGDSAGDADTNTNEQKAARTTRRGRRSFHCACSPSIFVSK
ncbi:MAG: hypothetical protein WCQ50_17045 [Spirochaetota bacterium]